MCGQSQSNSSRLMYWNCYTWYLHGRDLKKVMMLCKTKQCEECDKLFYILKKTTMKQQ